MGRPKGSNPQYELFRTALVERAKLIRQARELGLPERIAVPDQLFEPIRPKRAAGTVYKELPVKVIAPVSYGIKAAVQRQARVHRLCEADLILAILRHVIEDEQLVAAAVAAHNTTPLAVAKAAAFEAIGNALYLSGKSLATRRKNAAARRKSQKANATQPGAGSPASTRTPRSKSAPSGEQATAPRR